MIRVIADSRELLDQRRHAWQRPEIGFEAMSGCSAKELTLNQCKLLGIDARSSPGDLRPIQFSRVTSTPGDPPLTDSLLADMQDLSDKDLSLTLLK